MNDNKTIVTSIVNVSPVLTELLAEGMLVRFIVTGNSMFPMLRSCGDTVILKKKPVLKKYDLVLYRRVSGEFVLHRIVKIKDNILYMAGDHEVEIEHPIYPEQVIASVEGFCRRGRNISCSNPIYKLYCVFWTLCLRKRHIMVVVLKRLRSAIRSRRWKQL